MLGIRPKVGIGRILLYTELFSVLFLKTGRLGHRFLEMLFYLIFFSCRKNLKKSNA